jgi:hypothetical protein
VANIVRNYSPFLAPTTRSAPPTAELRRVLGVAAYDMLEEFLRKWRRVRSDSSTPDVRAVRRFSTLYLSSWLTDCVHYLRYPADRRYGASKVVCARRENDRPLCAS